MAPRLTDALPCSYYVDHENKKTQWEDPRLTHAPIWTSVAGVQLDMLRRRFGTAPEVVIKQALLKCAVGAATAPEVAAVVAAGATWTRARRARC